MKKLKVATCIGCGCDDNHACVDVFEEACYWLRIDRDLGVGVCSQCPDDVRRWAAGERAQLAPGAR